jgi:hypothetical protein
MGTSSVEFGYQLRCSIKERRTLVFLRIVDHEFGQLLEDASKEGARRDPELHDVVAIDTQLIDRFTLKSFPLCRNEGVKASNSQQVIFI